MKTKWIIGTLGALLLVASLAANIWLGATLRTYRYNVDHGWFTASDDEIVFPMTGLTSSELQQMLDQIYATEKDANDIAVLSVQVLGKNIVEIKTGILEAPLSGIGRNFRFNRTSNGWELDKKYNSTLVA